VADPPDADLALDALTASGGWGVALPDAAVLDAQRRLAHEEAIFAEPAGAAALAGLLADVAAGRARLDETAVCLVTGSGFEDPRPLHVAAPPPVLGIDDLDRLPDLASDFLDHARRQARAPIGAL
jgi:threonine synthase